MSSTPTSEATPSPRSPDLAKRLNTYRFGNTAEFVHPPRGRVKREAVEGNAAGRRDEVGTFEPQRVVGARIDGHGDQV